MILRNEIYENGVLVGVEAQQVDDESIIEVPDTEARVAELEAMLAAVLEVL